jgi:hypothetical protein
LSAGEKRPALGGVENDGDTGPVELVAQVRLATLRKKMGGESLELDGEAVTIELLGVQQRRV